MKKLAKSALLMAITAMVFTACNTVTAPAPITSTKPNASMTIANDKNGTKTSMDVVYYNDVKGFLVTPSVPGDYPGIVMIHEWWGLNDHIKTKAKELAAEGYNVLAVDLYHGEVATTPERARELTGGLDQTDATANLRAATKYLRDLKSTKIAALGWCFGGGQSLQLALSGENLDASVIYYGQLKTEQADLAPIKWPVLGVFGAKDTGIPVDMVNKFEAGLKANQTPVEIHIYPEVGHAFANPSNANYSPTETADAWEKTLAFLKANLQ